MQTLKNAGKRAYVYGSTIPFTFKRSGFKPKDGVTKVRKLVENWERYDMPGTRTVRYQDLPG